MREDHWAVGLTVGVESPADEVRVVAVDATGAPSRVELADGRVVDGDDISEIVEWGGAE